jgi:predicted porin
MFANKKLVAVAALTLVSGLANAQSALKIYGYLEAGYGSYKAAGDTSSVTKVESGNMMTSFLGFAGAEDLGGGLKAEFALETFIGVDSGATVPNQAGQFFGRSSWVGLSGGFGKLALGQYDNPLFTAGLSYNPFGSSMVFSPTMRQYYNLGSTSSARATNLVKADTAWINSITYETPTLAGFSGTLQYAPKESASGKDSSSYSVGLAFNRGALSLMGTYTDAGANVSSSTPTALAYPAVFRAASLNGSYDFGFLKAFAQYTDFKYNSGAGALVPASGSTTVVANLTGLTKAETYQLGVSAPITASGTLMASYGKAKYKQTGANATNEIYSVGYDQALSKRTSAYAAFTSEKLTTVSGGHAVAVGLKHNF